MSQIPDSPARILRTNERKQLYQLICEMQDDFNLVQLIEAAKKVRIKLSRTGILNFILTLCYHKYLEPYKLKTSSSRGRAKVYYKKSGSFCTLGSNQ